MSVPHWSIAEDEQLKTGIERGLSFGQIANVLKRSRCAVAGRVWRLGLTGPRSRPTPTDTPAQAEAA